MKLKEIDRTAMQAWSPAQQHPIYLATGEFWVAAVRWLWLEVICLFVLEGWKPLYSSSGAQKG